MTTADTTFSTSIAKPGRLIVRQHLATRITHWIWAVSLFFLLFSGLQIFNAHPSLHIGKEAGFDYSNDILAIGSSDDIANPRGLTRIFGHTFDTTGFLGVSGTGDDIATTAFPGWLTIPSTRDLATGRVVHFFFAWILVGTLAAWLGFSLYNRHLRKDLVPRPRDIAELPADIRDHLRFRFAHTTRYSPLQKLAYAGVLFVLFPLIVATGLTMSPGMDSFAPWLLTIFGGRQTARTIHFTVMLLLVAFFLIHMFMIVAAGPINELRSIITGRYRLSPHDKDKSHV